MLYRMSPLEHKPHFCFLNMLVLAIMETNFKGVLLVGTVSDVYTANIRQ